MFDYSRVLTALALSFEIWTKAGSGVCPYPSSNAGLPMSLFEMLTPAERARQLANPEGAVGVAVADWLNQVNKQANAKVVESLIVDARMRIMSAHVKGFG